MLGLTVRGSVPEGGHERCIRPLRRTGVERRVRIVLDPELESHGGSLLWHACRLYQRGSRPVIADWFRIELSETPAQLVTQSIVDLDALGRP